jgi:hypothetical protein
VAEVERKASAVPTECVGGLCGGVGYGWVAVTTARERGTATS